ncbi:hypothetical protein OROGR_029939 [Orobanche gracilis]
MVLLMEHHYTRVGNLTVVVGPTITVRLVTRMQWCSIMEHHWSSIEFLQLRRAKQMSGGGEEEQKCYWCGNAVVGLTDKLFRCSTQGCNHSQHWVEIVGLFGENILRNATASSRSSGTDLTVMADNLFNPDHANLKQSAVETRLEGEAAPHEQTHLISGGTLHEQTHLKVQWKAPWCETRRAAAAALAAVKATVDYGSRDFTIFLADLPR